MKKSFTSGFSCIELSTLMKIRGTRICRCLLCIHMQIQQAQVVPVVVKTNYLNSLDRLGKLCKTHSFVCLVSGQPEKIQSMKQVALDLKLSVKKTRKREFLAQMERVVPWAALVALIAPYHPEGRTGRPPFALETMLRVHFLQQWFSLSDPAMEEAYL